MFTKNTLLHVALECDYGAKCPDQQDNGFKGYTWLTRYVASCSSCGVLKSHDRCDYLVVNWRMLWCLRIQPKEWCLRADSGQPLVDLRSLVVVQGLVISCSQSCRVSSPPWVVHVVPIVQCTCLMMFGDVW